MHGMFLNERSASCLEGSVRSCVSCVCSRRTVHMHIDCRSHGCTCAHSKWIEHICINFMILIIHFSSVKRCSSQGNHRLYNGIEDWDMPLNISSMLPKDPGASLNQQIDPPQNYLSEMCYFQVQSLSPRALGKKRRC